MLSVCVNRELSKLSASTKVYGASTCKVCPCTTLIYAFYLWGIYQPAEILLCLGIPAYSYELAMLQACSAILAPHDRLLTIQMPNKCRRLYKYFTTVAHDGHFRWSKDSLQIDSRSLEELANVYKPRLVAVPSKCFGHFVDLGTINTISHKGGAYVLVDITETSGLIVAGILASPFKYADIVICGTQGSLCGPRAALIFFRKSMRVRSVDSKITTTISTRNDQLEVDLEQAVHASVFPRHQGGPHNHAIMATAVALAQCQTATFRSSQKLALTNAAALMDRMRELGYDVRGGDSPSYELVIKIGDGSHSRMKLDRAILDGAHITVDDTAATTNEERHLLHLGTNATTSRGFSPPDYYDVAGFIDRALTIAKEMHCSQNHDKARSEVMSLRREVNDWTSKFEALYGFEQT